MKAKVCELYASGLTMQEVGDALGISRQRVHQIVSTLMPNKAKQIEFKKLRERHALKCPFCLQPVVASTSSVVNSRKTPRGVLRRRECVHCSKRFTTYEVTEAQYRRWIALERQTVVRTNVSVDSIEV
jgi:hypothetical protein